MKKMFLFLLGLLVMLMFVVGCAPKELSLEEQKALESELSQMSDDELDQVIQEGESEDTKALAGQAYSKVTVGKTSIKPSTALKVVYKVKAQRYNQIKELEAEFSLGYCLPGYDVEFNRYGCPGAMMPGVSTSDGHPITGAYSCILNPSIEQQDFSFSDESSLPCKGNGFLLGSWVNGKSYCCFY